MWIGAAAACLLLVGALVWVGSGDDPKDETTQVAANESAPKTKAAPAAAAAEAEAKPKAPEQPPAVEEAPAVVAAAEAPEAAEETASGGEVVEADGETGADADAEPVEAADAGEPIPADANADAVVEDEPVPEEDPVVEVEPATADEPAIEVEPEPEPEPAPAPAAPGVSAEYKAAAAQYEETKSQESLAAMTLAACRMDDGFAARDAFRKLKGRSLRTSTIVDCREVGIDVLARVTDYTGPEYLRKAQAAMDAGDIRGAMNYARSSNRVKRSSAALSMMSLAACKLGDAEEAERLFPHVAKKARAELIAGCAEHGIELGK